MSKPKTLFVKIWDAHVVDVTDDGLSMIYADRVMLMEMQPQAFEGLRRSGLKVRRPEKVIGIMDHVAPTGNRLCAIDDPVSRALVEQARVDYDEFGIEVLDIADGVHAMVVPGPGLLKQEAEAPNAHAVFLDAGFEWREPGCSICIAMNGDFAQAGERCASTSNRNFEGRQGGDARTHLLSPTMAAAAAVTGRLSDVREMPLLDG